MMLPNVVYKVSAGRDPNENSVIKCLTKYTGYGLDNGGNRYFL